MSRQPSEILSDALAHFDHLHAHAQHDLEDQLVIDAICMRLSAGIEVLATLPAEVRDRMFGAQWQLIWGMRNRIAHGYLLVDADIIRMTVTQDVADIVTRITTELDEA